MYGYTTLLERLYPQDVAQDMLYSNFVRNFDHDNGCSMRFGAFGYAIDGSLACVIKAFLTIQQADSNLKFLKVIWPNVKRQMEIIFENFDVDDDGIIRCFQRNTYDSSMEGANTFIGSYWVTALKATHQMAIWMGDDDFAKKCINRAKLAATNYERICWKEEYGYYVADVDETTCTNSYATGCCIDQLCATGLSIACGLGTNFDPTHEAMARLAICKYNTVSRPPFEDLQHHFYDGDTGVTVTTYPNGQLPNSGIYDTIVSSGFTYPVIAAMIYDGNVDTARTIAKHIRNRHSGINRSPWNEPECGLFYSRSMASWNVYDQACGFTYDSTDAAISICPKVLVVQQQDDEKQRRQEQQQPFPPSCRTGTERKGTTSFRCFVTVQDGWGEFRHDFTTNTVELRALYGFMEIKSLSVLYCSSSPSIGTATSPHYPAQAWLQEKEILATMTKPGKIDFSESLIIPNGSSLKIKMDPESGYVPSTSSLSSSFLSSSSISCRKPNKSLSGSSTHKNVEKAGTKMMRYFCYCIVVIVSYFCWMILSNRYYRSDWI